MFWTTEDIWSYIKKYHLEYASVYDSGVARTGCVFCMFGHWNDPVDRFALMKKSHPNLYNYCMGTLKMKEVISYIDKHVNKGKNNVPKSN
jgi:3'-phosphoadenosine 5'-phosphosulfate sulfotransferase (PAPS reductase)/FAD synthetase